ncbi:hypothetical protein [Streptomyces sp. NRRL S-350]|uniref:hypothetical protein n=1 Tax=Streptomyces sp. NRRL S-350 TaxID=1463902 RepID=UPI0004C06BA2|nr:hypothetical protein [Streptomyces sp. NRRL S-350]
MPITPNPSPPAGPSSWDERLETRIGVCAAQLTWWGHDFTDGAWPDTEDLAVLLARTVREAAEIPSMRSAHHALTTALGSVHAAERWMRPYCAASPAMACRHLHQATEHLEAARRHLADAAPSGRPSLPPQRGGGPGTGGPAGA